MKNFKISVLHALLVEILFCYCPIIHGNQGGIWQDPEQRSAVVAGAPLIAIDCNGNAIAVWGQEVGQAVNVYSSVFSAVPGPSELVWKQEVHRFPTQSDLINVLRWNPVRYLNPITSYNVYCAPYKESKTCCSNCCSCKIRCCDCPCVNAQLIGQIAASENPVFCHHNRRPCQKLTYCVTAVDDHGNETPVPTSVSVGV